MVDFQKYQKGKEKNVFLKIFQENQSNQQIFAHEGIHLHQRIRFSQGVMSRPQKTRFKRKRLQKMPTPNRD